MRQYVLILVLALVAIGGVIGLAVTRDLSLGLDLQGGTEVVLQAEADRGQEVTEEALATSVEIIRDRVDSLGVSEPEIRKQGDNQISVALAGVFDPARATELIGKTAKLEFYDLQRSLIPPSIDASLEPIPASDLYVLLSPLQEAVKEGEAPTQIYLFDESNQLIEGPAPSEAALLERLEGGAAPPGSQILGVPANRIVHSCTAESATVCPGGFPGAVTFYYLFQYQPNDPQRPVPELTGEDLELDGTRATVGGGGTAAGSGPTDPIVQIQFTGSGGERFHEVTREIARRGQLRAQAEGIPPELSLQSFAIVLDNEIRSIPTIDWRDNPDGIPGRGGAIITGLDDSEEAEELALVLRSGALPVNFVQVDRTDVSASLGKDSLREARNAAFFGLLAVAAFMLIVYRFLGVVAILGLGIYGALLYGAILLFGVVLTLPGFAGLILTVGVAADANIVIFERIKEEVRAGRSVRAAIATGYRRGFSTIVDANVVTIITAFVIFAVAISSVRGFALMLLIGTILSMLTAVAATRAFLGILSGFRWFDNPAFMGATAAKIPAWQRVDFIGKRRIWFSMSAVAVVVSVVALATAGLNLGIDFRGGSQVQFTTAAPLAVENVRVESSRIVPGAALVQGKGSSVDGGFTSFQIKTDSLTAEETNALQAALQSQFAAENIEVRNVSGSFSSQILQNAIVAVIVSLLLIALYITIRFQWRFALPVLIALAHDILFALGIYALAGREVTTPTVAAILTILGFSIYDTIIIFDRVRENMPIMKRSSIAAIVNQSLWEIIRRSLATTFVVLLPLVSLLLFGGATLKDFAFALIVGIASGAYSTIFIAAPLFTVFMEREPEYAKRKGVTMPSGLEKPLDEPDATPAPLIPEPAPAPLAVAGGGEVIPERKSMEPTPEALKEAEAAARREARRKRRRSKPHGRRR